MSLPLLAWDFRSTATVTIFDDTLASLLFEEPVTHVSESIGIMEVKVLRTSGSTGNVIAPYKTIGGDCQREERTRVDTCGEPRNSENDGIV